MKLYGISAVSDQRIQDPEIMRVNPFCLALGYNEFDFFKENKEHKRCDGCEIEI
jgi:hypothetical protein